MANEPNRQWFRYISDGGVNFGIVADQDWGTTGASGLTTFNSADPAWGPQSTQHRTRKAVYRDPAQNQLILLPQEDVSGADGRPYRLKSDSMAERMSFGAASDRNGPLRDLATQLFREAEERSDQGQTLLPPIRPPVVPVGYMDHREVVLQP